MSSAWLFEEGEDYDISIPQRTFPSDNNFGFIFSVLCFCDDGLVDIEPMKDDAPSQPEHVVILFPSRVLSHLIGKQ